LVLTEKKTQISLIKMLENCRISLKFNQFSLKNEVLFVIAVIFIKAVCYKREISLVKDAKPN